MTAKELFVATLPFVWLKLSLKMIFVVIKVGAISSIIWGFMQQGVTQHIQYGIDITMGSLRFLILPIILLVVVMPILSFALRIYGRYMVRVGHIAVIVRVVKTSKLPRDQIGYGFGMVKKHFMTANMFFILDKLVHHAVVELQSVMRGALMNLGLLAGLVSMFKHNLINHIDECCIGYAFLHKNQKPLKSTLHGIVTYVSLWEIMAKRAVVLTLESVGISFLFYGTGITFLLLGVFSQNYIGITASLLIIFIGGAVKSCVLDTYVMVNMLVAFIQEVQKQNKKERTSMNTQVMQTAHLSRQFAALVFHANREDDFLTNDEAERLMTLQALNRNVGILP